MLISRELLLTIGQRTFWSLLGGVVALSFARLASPAATPPTEVHIHNHEPPAAQVAEQPPAKPPAQAMTQIPAPRAFPTHIREPFQIERCNQVRERGGMLRDSIISRLTYISREHLERQFEQEPVLSRGARVFPEVHGGKTIGVRVYGLRPGTVLHTLGIENGDLLLSIDRWNLTDPEQALEAYAHLRSADRITIGVLRRGQFTPLEVEFCP